MADRSKESNIWPVILVSILVGFIFFGNYIFDYFGINLNDRNISEEVKKKPPVESLTTTDRSKSESDSKLSETTEEINSNESLPKSEKINDSEKENITNSKEEIKPLLPEIGFIRVENDGSGIISGTGEPGSTMSILLNDTAVTNGLVSEDGQFAFFFELPEFNKPFKLSLEQKSQNGSINNSTQSALINPVIKSDEPEDLVETVDNNNSNSAKDEDTTISKGALDEGIAITSDISSDGNEEIVNSTNEDTKSIVSQNKINEETKKVPAENTLADDVIVKNNKPTDNISNQILDKADDQSNASVDGKVVSNSSSTDITTEKEELTKIPTIVIIDDTEIEVVQVPKVSSENLKDSDSLGIEVIAYDNDGEVTISGKGNVGDFVRVYIDDKPVKSTSIGLDGSWVTPLTGLKQGLYTLRADEISPDGIVVGRVETPFQRESIELAAKGASAITVQPGYTLWAIARERYGSGFQYVRVYQANLDLIKDPDLIYPGQVFNLPKE
jgi:hypothetical protein